MKEEVLEKYYQEGLEERLIAYLAKVNRISLERAMDIYYHSNMANLIHEGSYGVQYLDYKVLTQILMDTEPELFAKSIETNTNSVNTGTEQADTE